jgi:hypothetical protein
MSPEKGLILILIICKHSHSYAPNGVAIGSSNGNLPRNLQRDSNPRRLAVFPQFRLINVCGQASRTQKDKSDYADVTGALKPDRPDSNLRNLEPANPA